MNLSLDQIFKHKKITWDIQKIVDIIYPNTEMLLCLTGHDIWWSAVEVRQLARKKVRSLAVVSEGRASV
ncbi:hypothetical protein [Nostoc sp. FACHB-110]|uniref:hypothetical protein n=1 Tax=Nostoc sp. FACHB-110 TaxID=2692834 RepID=UPI001687D898|nr:hypothetical protein [Nostoc sp. FACHB-110]MBD2440134.1 hypothetical protein [Nostoc sp. FACHB-110]